MDISDINGDILAINTGLSMSGWNFSDEDSSPEPIDSPSQFIMAVVSLFGDEQETLKDIVMDGKRVLGTDRVTQGSVIVLLLEVLLP